MASARLRGLTPIFRLPGDVALAVCRYSGSLLIGLCFLLEVRGIDEILLLTRGIGAIVALLAGALGLAMLTLIASPGSRARVLGAGLIGFAAGAGATWTALELTAPGGDTDHLWALTGGTVAGLAVGARTAIAAQRRIDPQTNLPPLTLIDPQEFVELLQQLVAWLALGVATLLACVGLIALEVEGALPGLLLVGSACVLIVRLVGVSVLLALPNGLLPALAAGTPPRRAALRGSALQPLPDVAASAIASLVTIGSATRPRRAPPADDADALVGGPDPGEVGA